jgi:putative ABC transport system permease protein
VGVIRLINRDFLILVGIALVIALPLSGYLMGNWLNDYVYRYHIGPLLYLWPALATSLLAVFIISLQTWRVATANPSDSLREQ